MCCVVIHTSLLCVFFPPFCLPESFCPLVCILHMCSQAMSLLLMFHI